MHWLASIVLLGTAVQANYLPKSIWGKYRCPVNNSTLPSPTYGSTAVFTTCSESVINAPVEKVYAAIINFGNYHIWNKFVQDVKGLNGTISPAGLGVEMQFSNYGLIGESVPFPSDEIVTYLQSERDYAFAGWKYNDHLGGIFQMAEHSNVLTATANGGTRYVSWESYFGLGALPTDLVLADRLRQQFALQGDNLKAYVENMA